MDGRSLVGLIKEWRLQQKAWDEVSSESVELLERWLRNNDSQALADLYVLLQEEDDADDTS